MVALISLNETFLLASWAEVDFRQGNVGVILMFLFSL